MNESKDLDLLIILEIVKFLRIRREQSTEDALISGSLSEIVRNLPLGATIGSFFDRSTTVVQEAHMGDTYSAGQVGAQGPGAIAIGQHFQQIWSQSAAEIDLNQLASELGTLREEARSAGGRTPEEDVAVAELAKAEMAARDGDGPKALNHLSRAGKWALGLATSIGVPVAAKAIQTALGFG